MQQQKGNVRVTTFRDQFLLLRMKINDENNRILFHERAFSEVLEEDASKTFSGGKLLNSHFPTVYLSKSDYFATHFLSIRADM